MTLLHITDAFHPNPNPNPKYLKGLKPTANGIEVDLENQTMYWIPYVEITGTGTSFNMVFIYIRNVNRP